MFTWTVPDHFKVLIGGNTYIDCPTIVSYKGKSLFKLLRSDTNGYLGINFDIHAKDGSKVATVRNAQFVDSRPPGYEIEGSADRYILMETETGRIVCDIRFREEARGGELEVSADMYMPDGTHITFDPHETKLPGGTTVKGCTFQGCAAAVVID